MNLLLIVMLITSGVAFSSTSFLPAHGWQEDLFGPNPATLPKYASILRELAIFKMRLLGSYYPHQNILLSGGHHRQNPTKGDYNKFFQTKLTDLPDDKIMNSVPLEITKTEDRTGSPLAPEESMDNSLDSYKNNWSPTEAPKDSVRADQDEKLLPAPIVLKHPLVTSYSIHIEYSTMEASNFVENIKSDTITEESKIGETVLIAKNDSQISENNKIPENLDFPKKSSFDGDSSTQSTEVIVIHYGMKNNIPDEVITSNKKSDNTETADHWLLVNTEIFEMTTEIASTRSKIMNNGEESEMPTTKIYQEYEEGSISVKTILGTSTNSYNENSSSAPQEFIVTTEFIRYQDEIKDHQNKLEDELLEDYKSENLYHNKKTQNNYFTDSTEFPGYSEEYDIYSGYDDDVNPPTMVLSSEQDEIQSALTDEVNYKPQFDELEILKLIPVIIEQKKLGHITDQEELTLQEIFGDLWPIMMEEVKRTEDQEMNPVLKALLQSREIRHVRRDASTIFSSLSDDVEGNTVHQIKEQPIQKQRLPQRLLNIDEKNLSPSQRLLRLAAILIHRSYAENSTKHRNASKNLRKSIKRRKNVANNFHSADHEDQQRNKRNLYDHYNYYDYLVSDPATAAYDDYASDEFYDDYEESEVYDPKPMPYFDGPSISELFALAARHRLRREKDSSRIVLTLDEDYLMDDQNSSS